MADSPMHIYNVHMMEWRSITIEYEKTMVDAARADAQWKSARARVIVREKHRDGKIAIGLAEAIADSDPVVEPLALVRFVTLAAADAIKKKLEWARAYADNLRTNVVNDREENKLGSQAGAGPGRTTFEPGYERPNQPPPPPPAPDGSGWYQDGTQAPPEDDEPDDEPAEQEPAFERPRGPVY